MTVDMFRPSTRAGWLAQRTSSVGASAIGCLLGPHDYWTPFSLWAIKSGLIEEDPEETAPMQRGRLLEGVAVQLLREQNPTWEIDHNAMPGGQFFVDRDVGLSSTPDVFVNDPVRGPGVLQVKSVEAGVFRRKWKDEEGDVAPPLWIAVQAIIDAHMTGAKWAAVAPLVVSFGMDMPLIEVPLHEGVIAKARAAAAEFWTWVADKRPPPLDYMRDGRIIEDLYAPSAETVDMSGDNMMMALADEREVLSGEKSDAEKRLKAIKAEILAKMNGAAAARIADGRLIRVSRVERKGYEVQPTSYINLKVSSPRSEA